MGTSHEAAADLVLFNNLQVLTLISLLCVVRCIPAVPDPPLLQQLSLEGTFIAMGGEGAPAMPLPHLDALSHDIPVQSAAAPTAGRPFKSLARFQRVPAETSMASSITNNLMAQAPSQSSSETDQSSRSAAASGRHVIPRRGDSERMGAGSNAAAAPSPGRPFEGFPRAIQFAVESSMKKAASHMAQAATHVAQAASQASAEGEADTGRYIVPPSDIDSGVSELINSATFQEASFCLDKSFGAYQNPGADQRCFYFCTGFQGLGSVQCCAWNSCWRPPAFLLPFGSCGTCPSPPPPPCAPPSLTTAISCANPL